MDLKVTVTVPDTAADENGVTYAPTGEFRPTKASEPHYDARGQRIVKGATRNAVAIYAAIKPEKDEYFCNKIGKQGDLTTYGGFSDCLCLYYNGTTRTMYRVKHDGTKSVATDWSVSGARGSFKSVPAEAGAEIMPYGVVYRQFCNQQDGKRGPWVGVRYIVIAELSGKIYGTWDCNDAGKLVFNPAPYVVQLNMYTANPRVAEVTAEDAILIPVYGGKTEPLKPAVMYRLCNGEIVLAQWDRTIMRWQWRTPAVKWENVGFELFRNLCDGCVAIPEQLALKLTGGVKPV